MPLAFTSEPKQRAQGGFSQTYVQYEWPATRQGSVSSTTDRHAIQKIHREQRMAVSLLRMCSRMVVFLSSVTGNQKATATTSKHGCSRTASNIGAKAQYTLYTKHTGKHLPSTSSAAPLPSCDIQPGQHLKQVQAPPAYFKEHQQFWDGRNKGCKTLRHATYPSERQATMPYLTHGNGGQ